MKQTALKALQHARQQARQQASEIIINTMLSKAFAQLPTEIIGIICEFSDFQTHTKVRSTCSAVRAFVPRVKVVSVPALKELLGLGLGKNGKRQLFQEFIHLDLNSKNLTMENVKFLKANDFSRRVF